MRLRSWWLLAGLVIAVWSPCGARAQQEAFAPEFRIYRPLDPLVEFPVLSAKEGDARVGKKELVLGVVIGDQARAYPLDMINNPLQEVVNDTLGDQPIVASWCARCFQGIVYSRKGGKKGAHKFYVAGLWKGGLVMADAETQSLWSQALGKAMSGPLKGEKLAVIPSQITSWGEWRKAHPETTVLVLPRTSRQFEKGSKVPPARLLIGMAREGKARAWPLDQLQKKQAVNTIFADIPLLALYQRDSTTAVLLDRRVGDQELTFRLEGGRLVDEQTSTTWDPTTGRATSGPLKGETLELVPAALTYKDAWMRFHPQSTFWSAPGANGG